MKRFALILTFLFALMLPMQVFAADSVLNDPLSSIPSSERQDIHLMADALAEAYDLDVILAVDEADDMALAANQLYDRYGTDAERAVVMLIDPARQEAAIHTYGQASEIFNQIWIDSFVLDCQDALQQADYTGIMTDFILQAEMNCSAAWDLPTDTGAAVLLSNGDAEIDVEQKVYDYASLLTDVEEEIIADKAKVILADYSYDVAVVTTADAEGKSSMEYADDFYDYNGFGFGEGKDGFLLLIDMENRMVWLSTCGAAIPVLTDAEIQQLTDDIASYLSEADYYLGCCYALDTILDTVRADVEMATFGGRLRRSARRLPGYILVAAIAGGITVAIMAFRGKTARKARNAAGYLDRGSMRLSVREDRYLRSATTRTRIESSSGGSGGGGSSTHRSSSGRSHGGGGSRF